MTQPFTYRIQCIHTSEYYYGVRYARNCRPSDLWTTYFTSSKKVKNLLKKYGPDGFKIEIRKIFNSAEEAILWEHRVNRHTKLWPNYLNESDSKHQGMKYSSIGGLCSKEKMVGVHDPMKPWLNDSAKIVSMKNGNKRGGSKTGSMPWWNNGIRDTKSEICPGEGWVSGMLPKGHYWNNGSEQKISSECPGEGWIRGGIGSTNKGMSWWNNGVEQGMFCESPGNLWKPGLLTGTMSWWNNGVIQKRQKECPGDNWQKGMLRKNQI